MSTFQSEIPSETLSVTDAARGKLAELLKEADDEIEGIRVYLTGGGCSGMSYGMTFTDAVNPYDRVLKTDGVTLIVDAIASSYMSNTEIDFVEQGVNASFVFNNAFSVETGGGGCSGCA